MVRALKLETSGSGTYYNLSQGAFITPSGEPSLPPGPAIAGKRDPLRYDGEVRSDASLSSGTNAVPASTGRGSS
jgi:hypothetical protein